MLRILTTDLLGHRADGIVLTIDGAMRGMEGRTAREFAKRWPEAFAEAEPMIEYPLPLGESQAITLSAECPFGAVIIASTLHHLDVLDDAGKGGLVRAAFETCLHEAKRIRCTRIATGLLTGGWRLTPDQALIEMVGAIRSAHAGVDVDICVPTEDMAGTMREKIREWGAN